MPISCVGGEAAAGTRVYRRVLYILKIDIQGSTTNMMRNVPEMLLNRANISPVPEPLQQSNISLTRPGSEMPSRHIHESGMTRGGRSTLKVSQASPQSIHDRNHQICFSGPPHYSIFGFQMLHPKWACCSRCHPDMRPFIPQRKQKVQA